MHIDSPPARDEQRTYRDILRIIAAHTENERCVRLLLELAQSATGANGGTFVMFDTPNVRIDVGVASSWTVEDESLHKSVFDLPEGLELNPPLLDQGATVYPTVLAAPIFVDQRAQGGFWLLFAQPYTPSDEEHSAVAALIDGLTIVAARWQAVEAQRGDTAAMNVVFQSADPVLLIDDTDRIIALNHAAESLFGITPVSAQGKPLADLSNADRLILAVEGKETSWRNSPESPETRVFAPKVMFVPGSTARIVLLHDITELANRSEFMRVVAHDLRQPLTALKGYASILEAQLKDAENPLAARQAEKILNAVERLNAQIEHFQDADRFDPVTGFYVMKRDLCDVREIVMRVYGTYPTPADKTDLVMVTTVADDVPVIYADAVMLERAITNLVDNAVKYTPNGSHIDIDLRLNRGNVVFSVQDDGPGISPANQKRLFKRNVRLKRPEHNKIKGSGLGLFIVRGVAERHGGKAWVESIEGQGSTFGFNIPLAGANIIDHQLPLSLD
jgi:signal transduction histidine kinase